MHGQTIGHMDTCMDRQMDGHTVGHMDKCMDRQIIIQFEYWMNSSSEQLTCI